MAKIKGAIVVNTQRGKGCALCVVACPVNVLALEPNAVKDQVYHDAYISKPDVCIGAANCGYVSPDCCTSRSIIHVD